MFVLIFVACALVVLATIAYPIHANRQYRRQQNERKIQESARRERALERERVARVKRIARQDAIGDRIFWSLVEAWKAAGSPTARQVLRIRHNFGSSQEGGYYIEIGGNTGDPINTLLWLDVELRHGAGKEIVVTGPTEYLDGQDYNLQFPASDGEGWVKNILADRIFAAK